MSGALTLRDANPEQQNVAARRTALRVIVNNGMEPSDSLLWQHYADNDLEIPTELKWQFELDNQSPLDFSGRSFQTGVWAVQSTLEGDHTQREPQLSRQDIIDLKARLQDSHAFMYAVCGLVDLEQAQLGRGWYNFQREGVVLPWLQANVEAPGDEWTTEDEHNLNYTPIQISDMLLEGGLYYG